MNIDGQHAARELQQRKYDLQEQMLKEMDRRAARRQKEWNIICDIPMLAAGACLLGALQQNSLAWAVAAAMLYMTSCVGKEVQW